jgi:Raf kinase inhibitor-like YbhB/YbcL family protein
MRALAGLLATSVALSACGIGARSSTTNASRVAALEVASPAFEAGQPIPRGYTCDGRDLPLPLRWSGVPSNATRVSVVMRDQDAPGGNFVHWNLAELPPHLQGLDPGRLPAGAVQGPNGFGDTGYRGPCPPPGDKPHHYVVTVQAFAGNTVVASGRLTGTYARR